MKKEVADAWIKALRDGPYQQTVSRLRKVDHAEKVRGHCCLGVLCDLYLKETGQGEWIDNTFKIGGHDLSSTTLPTTVMNWAGMRSHSGNFGGLGKSLMHMNDSGASFKTIADAIEKNWSIL